MNQEMRLKPLDKNAVRMAASRLMDQNYSTTTLEVKQLLRTQKYWAIQFTVSRWLEEIAEEDDWYFISNNYHRNYFKNEITANYFTHMSPEEMAYYAENVKFSVN